MLVLIQPIYAYAAMAATALMVGVNLETAPMMNRPGDIAPAGASIMYDDTGAAADWLKTGGPVPKSEKDSTVPPMDENENSSTTGDNHKEQEGALPRSFRTLFLPIFF